MPKFIVLNWEQGQRIILFYERSEKNAKYSYQ